MPKCIPLTERFFEKVEADPATGCWLWTAHLDPAGYGQFWYDGQMRGAHRAAYQMFVGPIPEGLDLDHTCHNADLTCDGGGTAGCSHRRCVNPAHLEAVSRGTNLHRGASIIAGFVRQTECINGHDITDRSNLYPHPRGWRVCRQCHLDRGAARRLAARS